MKVFSALVAVALCLTITAGQDNIVQTLQKRPEFSLLVGAVTLAKLPDALSTGPFTVFAPTNDAFIGLLKALGYTGPTKSAQDLQKLLPILSKFLANEATPDLKQLLLYHVSAGTKNSAAVKGVTQIPTLFLVNKKPQTIGVKVEGNVITLVDKAPTLPDPKIDPNLLDISASNGIIHGITGLLINQPVNVEAAKKLLQTLLADSKTPAPTGPKTPKEPAPEPTRGAEGEPTPTATVAATPVTTPAAEPSPSPTPICFPASATIHTADGVEMVMKDLSAGHTVRVAESGKTSAVYLFSHKQTQGLYEFVRVTAQSGRSITLSPVHYLYANGRLTTARSVKVGDVLRTIDGKSTVKSVETVKDFGLIAPHTLHGDIVVNGIVASSYTATVHPKFAHMVLAPIRALVYAGIAKEPLGGLIYNGADRWAKVVPSGPEVY